MTVTFAPATIEPLPAELVAQGWPEVGLAMQETPHNVNVSNVNAARLLQILGYELDAEEGPVGDDTADGFLGKVLIALALEPYDSGLEAYKLTAEECAADPVLAAFGGGRPNSPTVWFGGRYEGYTQDRLEQLLRLATHCKEIGATVAWA